MDQVRDALLNSFSPLLVRAHRVVLVVAAEQTAVGDFLLKRDIMRRAFISSVVAFLAEVEVAAALAVPARRNSRFADVAGEALGRESVVRIVQRVEETHGRVLRPSERRKLPMLVARLVQKRIAPVHQIAGHVLVRVLNRRQSGLRLHCVHADDEEHLLVAVHQAVELVHQVAAAVVLFALARGALLLRFVLVAVQTVFGGHFSFFLRLFFENFGDQIFDRSWPKVTVEIWHLRCANYAVVFGLKRVKKEVRKQFSPVSEYP